MVMVAHHLNPDIPEDVAFADSRIRAETIAAEDVLHDMGIFSITSSDSQAMGRVGETITRTWQVADHMKRTRGSLTGDAPYNDNNRLRRFIAKYTINPAIAHGVDYVVGSVEEGKFADLVLWDPKFFGVKPDLVIKGGLMVNSLMGDSNGSIPTPQPRTLRNTWGAFGQAVSRSSITFLSQDAIDANVPDLLNLRKQIRGVRGVRNLTKRDMKLNAEMPDIRVDPETYQVFVNGELITSKPAETVPMARRYFLF